MGHGEVERLLQAAISEQTMDQSRDEGVAATDPIQDFQFDGF